MTNINNIPTATEATIEAWIAELNALMACEATTYEESLQKTARLVRLTKCLRNIEYTYAAKIAEQEARKSAAQSVEMSEAAKEETEAPAYTITTTTSKGEKEITISTEANPYREEFAAQAREKLSESYGSDWVKGYAYNQRGQQVAAFYIN